MFKNLRTSTKLLLLCGLFVGSIVLATYSLIREQQIAINFVRQELLGTQYLGKLRAVYAAIFTDDRQQMPGVRCLSIPRCTRSLRLKVKPLAHSIQPSSNRMLRPQFANCHPKRLSARSMLSL